MPKFREALKLAFLCGLLLPAKMHAADVSNYELHGAVSWPEGIKAEGSSLIVQLSGVESDLQLSGVADAKGLFRFKKIPAGMYLLTAFIPRAARSRMTIEIGPSFADSKGRVEVSIRLAPRRPRPERFQVPAGQLGIPKRARDEYEKGMQRLSKRDRDGAAAAFARALTAAPEFSAAHYQLGIIASQQGRLSEAEAHYRTALQQSPGYYPYLLGLGGSLLALRDGAQAVSVNEGAVRARPEDPQAHIQMGYSYLLVGRLEDAEKHFKQTIALDPANYHYPQLALAEIYRMRQDYSAVVVQLEDFLKLHPDSKMSRDVNRILSEVRRLLTQPANP